MYFGEMGIIDKIFFLVYVLNVFVESVCLIY